MGYAHIKNLYAAPTFLEKAGSPVYALEKIHGTSANVTWKFNKESGNCEISFHAGGENHNNFLKLFDVQKLLERITALVAQHETVDKVIVHGEAYGGKQQGMKATYGDKLKFVAFDVVINDTKWLTVAEAEAFVRELGLEFVHYEVVENKLEALNAQRDRPSVQAERNGMGSDKQREGIVIKPLVEMLNEFGERLMVKHKGEAFRETATPREVETDPAKLKVINEAYEIANEYVVEERLSHVLDKLVAAGIPMEMKSTPKVLDAMVEDVKRESEGEVVWSKEAETAIKNMTRDMFKKRVMVIK